MKYAFRMVLVVFVFLSGCSEESFISSANEKEQSFLDTHRDKIIANWQTQVLPKSKCETFKVKFRTTGERFSGNQSEPFMDSMMKVSEEGQRAGCINQI